MEKKNSKVDFKTLLHITGSLNMLPQTCGCMIICLSFTGSHSQSYYDNICFAENESAIGLLSLQILKKNIQFLQKWTLVGLDRSVLFIQDCYIIITYTTCICFMLKNYFRSIIGKCRENVFATYIKFHSFRDVVLCFKP